MMSEFTPGPWEVSRDHVLAQGAFWIAETHGEDFETRVANARLIAAAPELLEAARNYAHDACYECFKGECDKPFHNALLRAIAKAEGK
jgi:hypothetical protein